MRFSLDRLNSLRVRLTSVMLLAVVLPSLGLLLWAGVYLGGAWEAEGRERLALNAEILAAHVELWDERVGKSLLHLSRQPAIVSMQAASQTPALQQTAAVYDDALVVASLGLNGVSLAHSDQRAAENHSERAYFKRALGGQALSRERVVGADGVPTVVFAAPIKNQAQQVLGVALMRLSLERLRARVGGFQLGQTGWALLVDADGNALAQPDFSDAAQLDSLRDYPPVRQLSQRGGGVYRFDQAGVGKVAYGQTLGNGWGLLVIQDAAEVASRSATLNHLLELVLAAIALLVGLVTWVLAGNLVRPLDELTAAVEALAHGELSDHPFAERGDELGRLFLAYRHLRHSIKNTIAQTHHIAAGEYDTEIELMSEQDELGLALQAMQGQLRGALQATRQQDWVKTGQTGLSQRLSGEQDLTELCEQSLNFLATYLKAAAGLFYVATDYDALERTGSLKLYASYAAHTRKRLANEFAVGEGLVGQAARERKTIIVEEVPEGYLEIRSGLGESPPQQVLVLPLLYEGKVKGVLELASLGSFSALHLEFLQQAAPMVAVALNTADARGRMRELLEQSQAQAEELQAQSEELQTQQEELRQTNETLEDRTRDLERQQTEVREKNRGLEQARQAIETKASELELANKYKSEFLANMSHELRTPLNSLLVLAQLLEENKPGNLTPRQLEQTRTIRSAGGDLLALIDDILDLSKVEAGKIEIQPERFEMHSLLDNLEQKFRHLAADKHLEFTQTVAEGIAPVWSTDRQRLQQVLNNLLSNAIKFTPQGRVALRVRPLSDTEASRTGLALAEAVAIDVIDTGIGVPADKQGLIFEAFQQADGTTSRKYGGTGLGLSISRQLMRLLGGSLRLESAPGQGSTFTLYLPHNLPPAPGASAFSRSAPPPPAAPVSAAVPAPAAAPPPAGRPPALSDDRADLSPEHKRLLVVEDDPQFARVLMELAREKGYRCLYANNGREALELARSLAPDGVLLDVGLPELDGFSVIDRLKHDPATRHIPVHMISGCEPDGDVKQMGALGYLVKPVNMGELGEVFEQIRHFADDPWRKLLLLAEPAQATVLRELMDGDKLKLGVYADAASAWEALEQDPFDCVVADLDTSGGEALKLLRKLHESGEERPKCPVLLYAQRELSAAEQQQVREYAGKLTLKTIHSPERLLDQATLFLHRLESDLPAAKQQMLRQVHHQGGDLKGKKILLVDDDIRNIYAITGLLEGKEMQVLAAKNGHKALQLLEQETGIDLVLMDIMMPELDGYETMRAIRAQPRFRHLPIIALTAKAMKGDKTKCLEAGANDYLAKPVHNDKLLSLMRVWLYS